MSANSQQPRVRDCGLLMRIQQQIRHRRLLDRAAGVGSQRYSHNSARIRSVSVFEAARTRTADYYQASELYRLVFGCKRHGCFHSPNRALAVSLVVAARLARSLGRDISPGCGSEIESGSQSNIKYHLLGYHLFSSLLHSEFIRNRDPQSQIGSARSSVG